MKIKPPRSRKKKFILPLAILLVALLSYGTYALNSHRWPFVSSSTLPHSSMITAQDGQKTHNSATHPSDDKASQTSSPKTPAQSSSSITNDKGGTKTQITDLKAQITTASQNDSILRIRTLIETVSSSGSCELTLKGNSSTVTQRVGIQALANSSTCKGFNVPVSELSEGQWVASIKIASDGKTTILTKNITITN